MSSHSNKRTSLEPLEPSKRSKGSKVSLRHGDLDFGSNGHSMSDIMDEADMKSAYYAAIAAAHEAFAGTLRLKMLATVEGTTGVAVAATSTLAPRVLSEPNGTPLGLQVAYQSLICLHHDKTRFRLFNYLSQKLKHDTNQPIGT